MRLTLTIRWLETPSRFYLTARRSDFGLFVPSIRGRDRFTESNAQICVVGDLGVDYVHIVDFFCLFRLWTLQRMGDCSLCNTDRLPHKLSEKVSQPQPVLLRLGQPISTSVPPKSQSASCSWLSLSPRIDRRQSVVRPIGNLFHHTNCSQKLKVC